jgi:hypothetical protein
MFDNGSMDDPESLDHRLARVDAQHWEQPWQVIRNSYDIPATTQQRRCHVLVRATLAWERDGREVVETLAYGWSVRPRLVLVEVRSRRCRFLGAWIAPWDLLPHRGPATLWMTPWGAELDAPPWAG